MSDETVETYTDCPSAASRNEFPTRVQTKRFSYRVQTGDANVGAAGSIVNCFTAV